MRLYCTGGALENCASGQGGRGKEVPAVVGHGEHCRTRRPNEAISKFRTSELSQSIANQVVPGSESKFEAWNSQFFLLNLDF